MDNNNIPENIYSKGFIYRIRGNDKTYIGSSTCKTAAHRFAKHKYAYKYYKNNNNNKYGFCTSFHCLDDPNCYIELLEKFPCSDRDELRKRERYWQELETNRINNRIAFLTPEEKEHSLKLYREANREYFKLKAKEQRDREKIKCNNENIKIENKNVVINFGTV
jgi:hypothetical protein